MSNIPYPGLQQIGDAEWELIQNYEAVLPNKSRVYCDRGFKTDLTSST